MLKIAYRSQTHLGFAGLTYDTLTPTLNTNAKYLSIPRIQVYTRAGVYSHPSLHQTYKLLWKHLPHCMQQHYPSPIPILAANPDLFLVNTPPTFLPIPSITFFKYRLPSAVCP